MGNVAPPSGGLGSNANYIIASNGNPLQDLKVTIDVTEDLLSSIGLSFQLNGYSPGGDISAWQQYFLYVQTADWVVDTANVLYGQVEPWPATSVGTGVHTTTGDLINQHFELATLSADSAGLLTIPAGSKLEISFGADGTTQNIRYVTFAYTDSSGKSYNTNPSPIDLEKLPLSGSTKDAQAKDLAPLIAFELDVVGPTNGLQTYLVSGAGTITYSASNELTVYTDLSAVPATPDSNFVTVESANSAYGELAEGSHTSITQSFTVVDPGAFAPGGPIAASQHFGTEATQVYGIDRAGQFVIFFVEGSGHWSSTTGFGPTGLTRRGAAIAASQQFGVADQTDAFVIAQNGQLNVFWVDAAGTVSGPSTIGAASFAPPGGALAACQQFGATNQTDVFLVDNKGALAVFWVEAAGGWSGPQSISAENFAPSGGALAACQQFGATNQTDVFLVDNSGTLVVFWVEAAGNWNGPQAISAPGFAPPGAGVAASQQFGVADQTDVFLVDNNGALNVFWVDGGGHWNGPEVIGATPIASKGSAVAASQQFGAGGQTDVFLVSETGTNGPGAPTVFWVGGSGSWAGPKALVSEV